MRAPITSTQRSNRPRLYSILHGSCNTGCDAIGRLQLKWYWHAHHVGGDGAPCWPCVLSRDGSQKWQSPLAGLLSSSRPKTAWQHPNHPHGACTSHLFRPLVVVDASTVPLTNQRHGKNAIGRHWPKGYINIYREFAQWLRQQGIGQCTKNALTLQTNSRSAFSEGTRKKQNTLLLRSGKASDLH